MSGPSQGLEELHRLQWSPARAGPLELGSAGLAGGGGQGKQSSKARERSGAANLLSLLLCASVHVVGGLKLGLHSLIIYLGKEEEAGEPRGSQETEELGVLPRSLRTRDQLPLEEL